MQTENSQQYKHWAKTARKQIDNSLEKARTEIKNGFPSESEEGKNTCIPQYKYGIKYLKEHNLLKSLLVVHLKETERIITASLQCLLLWEYIYFFSSKYFMLIPSKHTI